MRRRLFNALSIGCSLAAAGLFFFAAWAFGRGEVEDERGS